MKMAVRTLTRAESARIVDDTVRRIKYPWQIHFGLLIVLQFRARTIHPFLTVHEDFPQVVNHIQDHCRNTQPLALDRIRRNHRPRAARISHVLLPPHTNPNLLSRPNLIY